MAALTDILSRMKKASLKVLFLSVLMLFSVYSFADEAIKSYRPPSIYALSGKEIIIFSQSANNHVFPEGCKKFSEKNRIEHTVTGHWITVSRVIREHQDTRRDCITFYLEDEGMTYILYYPMTCSKKEHCDYAENITTVFTELSEYQKVLQLDFSFVEKTYIDDFNKHFQGTKAIWNAKKNSKLSELPFFHSLSIRGTGLCEIYQIGDTLVSTPISKAKDLNGILNNLSHHYDQYQDVLRRAEETDAEYSIRDSYEKLKGKRVHLLLDEYGEVIPYYGHTVYPIQDINGVCSDLSKEDINNKEYLVGRIDLINHFSSFQWYIELIPQSGFLDGASVWLDYTSELPERLLDGIEYAQYQEKVQAIIHRCEGDRLIADLKSRTKTKPSTIVNQYFESVPDTLALKANLAFAGKDIWLTRSGLFPDDRAEWLVNRICSNKLLLEYPSFSTYTTLYRVDGNKTVAYSNWSHPWVGDSRKELTYGLIGGDTYTFYNFRFDGIEKPSDSKIYYARLIPVPDKEFGPYKYTTGWEDKIYRGEDIHDAVLVPFSEMFINAIRTDKDIEDLASAIKEQEQRDMDEYLRGATVKYEALTRLYGEEIAGIINSGNVRFGFTSQMCKYALEREPYQLKYEVKTPLGYATEYNFYTQDIKLYFIDDILIGIAWRGRAIEYHMN